MFKYLETLGSTMENLIIIVVLFLLAIIVVGSGFFIFKIVKKIKEIKLKAGGVEADIEISTTDIPKEIKQSEGAEK